MVRFLRSRKTSDAQPPRRQPGDAARRAERASSEDLEARYTFRRSHTITGSASSEVTTLSEQSAQLKSPRVQAHDLARHRQRILGILASVIAICILLAILVTQFTATPKVVIDGDESIAAQSDYVGAIQHYFSGSPIERLRFMLNDQRLTTYLQAKHPEIERITQDGSGGFGVSRYELTMRKPVVSWAVNGIEEYVDRDGIAFSVNYSARPAVQIIDQSGIQLKTGQTLASNSFLSFVGQVVGLSESLEHLTVTKVVIPSGMTREVEVSVSGTSCPIKLSTDRPVGQQVEDMARAIAWMRQHGVTPQYIDVRVSRDAFYR